jgi:hypothetical protein
MQKGISILGKDPQTALKVSLVNLWEVWNLIYMYQVTLETWSNKI